MRLSVNSKSFSKLDRTHSGIISKQSTLNPNSDVKEGNPSSSTCKLVKIPNSPQSRVLQSTTWQLTTSEGRKKSPHKTGDGVGPTVGVGLGSVHPAQKNCSQNLFIASAGQSVFATSSNVKHGRVGLGLGLTVGVGCTSLSSSSQLMINTEEANNILTAISVIDTFLML
jgi:hypothetical protein